MLFKKIIYVVFLFLLQTSFAQKKTRADRFFEKGDYITAAKYYEEELQKEFHKKALENIAISYYNTFQYRKAALYLKQLTVGRFAEKDKTYDNLYNFKLYQILSALGDYETSLDYLSTYKKNLNQSVDKSDAISVIEAFKLKNPDYTIDRVKFNSDASDFGAIKFGDDVFFTSDRDTKQFLKKTYKWTHQSFLDIYSVRVDKELDTIGTIQSLPKSINSKLHEGNFCFSKDGNTLYVSRSNITNGKKEFNDKDYNNIHLYKSVKEDGYWSELEKLPININGFSYQHPALSPDENRLYFSSDQEGGFGSFDIYYVEIDKGIYGIPINLGSTINTENREHFPFISDEGHMFFSSNGHLGLGMLDIFVSEKQNNVYTIPVNLGAPINSQYDDFNLNYFNKDEGFFSSNRSRASDDIFKFRQTGEIFLREYNSVFEVRDQETKEPIANANVILTDRKNIVLYTNTLGDSGSFNRNLLPGNYKFSAENPEYKAGNQLVKTLEQQDQKHVLYLKKIPPPPPPPPIDPVEQIIAEKGIDKDLKEKDPERFELLTDTEGPPIVEKDGKLFFELEPIYFDFDRWSIRADSKLILDALAAKLERYPNIHLKISSHTDTRGTARYNQILSERRAEATRNYLALEGYINARRMKFQGFGESVPIIDCPILECTEDEHQLNRRSEFEIVEY